jgi:tetratricopeptide (TPR) repeat protein
MQASARALTAILAVVTASTMIAVRAQTAAPAQSRPATQTAPLPDQPPAVRPLEERVARLEERTQAAAALADQRIQVISERSEITTRLVYFASILGGFMILFFSIRDWYLRANETQRQRGIDEIVKETMRLQKDATTLQLKFGAMQLTDAESNFRQQGEGLQKVNQVIETVNRTLAFRLQQEENFARTIKDIERMKAEQLEKKRQKLAQAMAIHDHFRKMTRMDFASLTDEQYRRGLRLQSLVNDADDLLGEKDQALVAGSLLYDCGVIAFYDNDPVEAKAYLERSAASRSPDHDAQLEKDDYARRFSFVHYFRALIEKNWGDISQARHEIDQSMRFDKREGEFLTPVTRAEILSYSPGEEETSLHELSRLLERMQAVEADLKSRGKMLDRNQGRLRNRMLVLSGNIHFIGKEFQPALNCYNQAIAFQPRDYYALASAAQSEARLSRPADAQKHFGDCLEAIERSDDFRRKRERITRVAVAVTAANAAKGAGDTDAQERWTRDAREMLSGKLEVDGMSPKFFSPATKRQVSAADLLQELDI